MSFASLVNSRAIDLGSVPVFPFPRFAEAILDGVAEGQRVAALLGVPVGNGSAELYAVLADDARSVLRVGRTRVEGDSFPSLTPRCPQVHLFEREIFEQLGIRPEGHPWLKPVRFERASTAVGVTDFYRVEGEDVHEVAVGPVHAGIIEPGHFRFQCHGEEVFHLEISLGYQHRGVERSLVGGPTKRTVHTMETLAGDTSVGHGIAYCQIVEALAGKGIEIDKRKIHLRDPIKTLGESEVPVKLHREVTAAVKVKVVAET